METARYPTPAPPTSSAPPQRPIRLLRRSRQDKVIAGVCSGIGRYTNVDPVLVRVIVVALAIFGAGSGILAYLIAWIVIPRERAAPVLPPAPAESFGVPATSAVGDEPKSGPESAQTPTDPPAAPTS